MADRHHVHIEVLVLSVAVDGRLRYRRDVDHLQGSESPDEAAARIGDVPTDGTHLIHSTSWRHTRDAVVLTYVVTPDPHQDRDVVELSSVSSLSRSPDPARPGAGPIHTEHVVAHACRHLALLADADAAVASVAADHPDLWRTIRAHGLGLAGQLPAALHPIG